MGTSHDILIDEIYEQKSKKNFYRRKASKYEKGFDILYEYFDSIADEEKEEVSNKLDKLKL